MSAAPPDIFISYAREEVEWVRPLVEELERRGWIVFWDLRIPAGKNWRIHIGTRVEMARCVIVVWSESALKSKFVLQEAEVGLEREVLLPVLRQPVRPPIGFREVNCADLSAWRPGKPSEALEMFMGDVSELLGSVPGDPPPKPPGAPRRKGRTGLLGMAAIVVMVIAAALVYAFMPIFLSDPAEIEAALGMSETDRRSVQTALAIQGFDAGVPDGRLGDETRQAIGAWQSSNGLSVTGHLATGQQQLIRAGKAKAGAVFRDCPNCPEMVVIGAGSFTMGSPPDEIDRNPDEGPQRMVTFARPFAIGRYEVTFAEWDACVAGGGCGGHRPDDAGWGRDTRPIINVSWDDADAFVSWLSRATGESYRLPTEAEWEFAARGGTNTPFWTGATISTAKGNYDGDYIYGSGVTGIYRAKTVTVDDPSFPANPFGLHHVAGNVWEWVQDCYDNSYKGAPVDGYIAVDRIDCPWRVLRGGSWGDLPRSLRSAKRFWFPPVIQNRNVGFRVARALSS